MGLLPSPCFLINLLLREGGSRSALFCSYLKLSEPSDTIFSLSVLITVILFIRSGTHAR